MEGWKTAITFGSIEFEMKYCLLLVVFFVKVCFSQEVSVGPASSDTQNYNIRTVRIFNNLPKPIAIKCSASFTKFSDRDTLPLAMGNWYKPPNYYYGIDYSLDDSKVSENAFYHFLIIYPQTYVITNVKLIDLNQYNGAKFCLFYLTELSGVDIEKFSNRDSVIIMKENRDFRSKVVKLE